MKRRFLAAMTDRSALLPAATVLLAAGIFIFDTLTDLEIAAPALYVAVVLLAVGSYDRRGVLLVALGCVTLTIVSDLLSAGGSPTAGLINTGISLTAIGATTFLALRIKAAEAAEREARAQLTHIARVTMLGELTASIAHEVNQPLAAAVINGNACLRWLAAEPPNFAEAREAADRVIKNSNRASNVIARVRGLASRAPAQKEWLDITEVIRDVVALTAAEMRDNRISAQTDLADLPHIFADRVQLQQVMLNLILNAIEAMSDTDAESRRMRIEAGPAANGKAVEIVVSDSGRGFESGQAARMFDAFYTTKRGGMGMGLAISRSIVEAHDGRIWAEPAPRGAIFKFSLPVRPRGELTG